MRAWIVVTIGLLGCGCSIIPLPQDVTGPRYDTYGIVTRVRCEMRDAIKTYVIRLFEHAEQNEIADTLKLKPNALRWLNSRRRYLNADIQTALNRYDGAMITYDFTFDITENNNIGGSVDLGRTLTRGTFGFGITGQNDRERHNVRTFRVVDNFEKLSVQVDDSFCMNQNLYRGDYIYPITGSLNLFEMVGAFLDLNQSNNLAAKDKDPPALSDNIQFVTKWTGSLHPSFEISPVGRSLEVAKAGITGTGIREDKHSVIIVLTLPPEPAAADRTSKSQKQVAEELVQRQRNIKLESDVGTISRQLRLMLPGL
jgi:hypothetical protein